jgi:hypothetical protein
LKNFIVITTINEKSKAICEFEKMDGWHLVIVGDKKSKLIESNKRITFLSVEDQQKLDYGIIGKLPYNHYTRKNIGYLYAISQGAELIYDTDDDNFPYPDWKFSAFSCQSRIESPSKYSNVYRYFSKENIWPRGFPLDLIAGSGELNVVDTEIAEIGIWQGLADKDPDVDAIYRLVLGGGILSFESKPSIYLGKGNYCPFNSQNTLWSKRTFPLLYLPSTVSFRFTDILRGYIVQRLIWEQSLHLGFCSATVLQERNQHDLMKDFRDEVECYLSVRSIVDELDAMSFNGDFNENLLMLYRKLAKEDYVKEQEIGILEEWLADYAKASQGNLKNG